MYKYIICFVCIFSVSEARLNDQQKYLKLFRGYLNELERLDGDGLLPRSNRPLSWRQTTKILQNELRKAKSPQEVGRVFARLDAAYTNLHAHIDLGEPYSLVKSEGNIKLGVSIGPDEVHEDGTVQRFLIQNVHEDLFKQADLLERPQLGDEVVAINGKKMKSWEEENFNFCKFPLKSQCQLNFFDHFRKEVLSWYRRQPLKITLRRGRQEWTSVIPVVTKGITQQANKRPPACGVTDSRYGEFKLVYEGLHACAFENPQKPGVVVLRIGSFRYQEGDDKNEINDVRKEVNRFAEKYWSQKADKTQTLILDVVDNFGGDVVVGWSSLFLPEPFQDQWVQFKKTRELDEDSEWRQSALYHEPARSKVFDEYHRSGIWRKTPMGGYLPQQPQFCASDEGDCRTVKWPSRNSGFKGQMIFITNEWCISSCVGFVWIMKKYLKDRVQFAGVPDSGDSTFARAFLEGGIDHSKKGFFLRTIARKHSSRATTSQGALFQQVVSISRSTDEDGTIISGRPQKMDFFISPRWSESPDDWVHRVLTTVIGKTDIQTSPQ